MVVERSTLRSVDSEGGGRAIEPRKSVYVEANVVQKAEATSAHWVAGCDGSTGVEGVRHVSSQGSPGTWEISSFPWTTPGWRSR